MAARAGVSAMTVSNVINRAGRASPATVAAVRAAVEELGYVPNVVARRLARARATTVGVLYAGERTPFLDAILVGALRATNARGLQLVLYHEEQLSLDAAEGAVLSLARSGADALLLVPPFAELLCDSAVLAELALPVAAIATDQVAPGMSTVRIDNRAAMADLTALVVARGYRRIALVAGRRDYSVSAARIAGFQDALAAHGLPSEAGLIVEGGFDVASGEAAARRLLARDVRPDAIMCSCDDMAAGVIAEAHRRGLRLPHDLAVTGFDDTMVAARMWPSLTTVYQPAEEMAFRATEQLIGAGDGDLVANDLIVAHTIVERESTASLRAVIT
ncbi:substrate-binding domain-containing protein [Sphingomonas endophytica]|uniref:substrate-binding domain-containing protein n=1 Tax=Sphingomonas endophytica TaxID=869719 RepID=UPI000A745EAD|nr:substrate-binding domain-containing protein [Sphingomonas endophytica]